MLRLLVVLILGLMIIPALARNAGQWSQATPSQRDWFKKQISPKTKQSCCSQADGEHVDEEIRNGQYWIQSAWTGGHWMLVPDEVIIREPNLYKRPVAWFRQDPDGKVIIYCYAPGALM